jgi:hypothetical protein
MKAKTIAYWVTTGSIAFSIGSGGLAAALRVPGVVDGHGGARLSVHFILPLGVWKTLGAITILAPFALVCVLVASWWLRPDDRKLAR